VSGAHCAYNVFAVHAVYAPGANAVPEPSAAVFHPKNVYPDLVGCVVDIVNVDPLSHV
jgi:hypothetical protein